MQDLTTMAAEDDTGKYIANSAPVAINAVAHSSMSTGCAAAYSGGATSESRSPWDMSSPPVTTDDSDDCSCHTATSPARRSVVDHHYARQLGAALQHGADSNSHGEGAQGADHKVLHSKAPQYQHKSLGCVHAEQTASIVGRMTCSANEPTSDPIVLLRPQHTKPVYCPTAQHVQGISKAPQGLPITAAQTSKGLAITAAQTPELEPTSTAEQMKGPPGAPSRPHRMQNPFRATSASITPPDLAGAAQRSDSAAQPCAKQTTATATMTSRKYSSPRPEPANGARQTALDPITSTPTSKKPDALPLSAPATAAAMDPDTTPKLGCAMQPALVPRGTPTLPQLLSNRSGSTPSSAKARPQLSSPLQRCVCVKPFGLQPPSDARMASSFHPPSTSTAVHTPRLSAPQPSSSARSGSSQFVHNQLDIWTPAAAPVSSGGSSSAASTAAAATSAHLANLFAAVNARHPESTSAHASYSQARELASALRTLRRRGTTPGSSPVATNGATPAMLTMTSPCSNVSTGSQVAFGACATPPLLRTPFTLASALSSAASGRPSNYVHAA